MPQFKSVSSLRKLSADALGSFIASYVLPSAFLCTKPVPSSPDIIEQPNYELSDDVQSESEVSSISWKVNLPGDSSQYKRLPGLDKAPNLPNSISQEKETDHKCNNDCDVSNKIYMQVEDFLLEMLRTLTSYSHRTLHLVLFDAVFPKLNPIYMKHTSKQSQSIIRSIVPLFVNHNLTEFDFASYKMLTEASMFKEVYHQLQFAVNLETLIFGRSCYWRSKTMNSLSKILEKLEKLRVLHIHYICSPQILKDLPHSCPHLTELSLKGSNEITDIEVEYLAQFSNLETLDISGTSITGKGCSSILSKLPRLLWLTHCPFNCNSDTIIFESRAELFNYIKSQLKIQLENRASSTSSQDRQIHTNAERESVEKLEEKELGSHIHCLPPDEQEQLQEKPLVKDNSHDIVLNFKKFWLFNPSSREMVLITLCPKIEHLQLDFVMQDMDEEPDTSAIGKLHHLATLVLNIYDRCPIDFVESLVDNASHLTHLYLHLGDDWFFTSPIHNTIAQNCPHLVLLSMAGDYKGDHPLEESDSRLNFQLPPNGHPKLTEVYLTGCISDQRLLHLLIQAPSIETLHLDGELEWLHDETFSAALLNSQLSQLKSLWFNVSTSVTLLTIKKLLQGENKLERVGRLCLMASASKAHYQELLLYVRNNNLLTELIWVTDQRDLRK